LEQAIPDIGERQILFCDFCAFLWLILGFVSAMLLVSALLWPDWLPLSASVPPRAAT
jgi:hypothetical protein